MFGALVRRVFGTSNDRIIRGMRPIVAQINALEPEIAALSDEALRARTDWLRKRVADGESLDDVLVDAFATVREGAKRTLGQRHFDVQLMGGMVLHRGQIAEMKTGEGKTLVATLAVYLNALAGKGVHVVTVNDYLAKRDAEWMGQIYSFLGLSVGVIVHGLDDDERREAYACDVTYAMNSELGFDYLRDNMKFSLAHMAQRPFNFAIVDEVDSILIDEARTPLIISGPAEDSSAAYNAVDKLIPLLVAEDFEKDEKQRAVTLTEIGTEKVENLLRERGLLTHGTLYDLANITLVHHVNQALRAHKLFARDVNYMVRNGKVVIVDEFTGRALEGRRYSDGLHQALEAKEGVEVEMENQTLASTTYQNLFRLYPKLAGMTGTAVTEAGEFAEIYKLEVVEVPTNVDVARVDDDDEVYRTGRERDAAALDLIDACQKRRQPVLVGTVSIEKSESLSALLRERKIKHSVLNARYHEQEALIIAQAGTPGAVTIATNMAGRGTDIQLGGNVDMRIRHELANVTDEAERKARADNIRAEVAAAKEIVVKAGGLYVIGTERHESRRIDNQLRGRSGRQGDPGASKFFLSLEDDLMRIFGGERLEGMLVKLGLKEGEAIVHPWINKALEKAQQKVEARNFESRKYVLRYDDVMNDQRKAIFGQRREIMHAEDVADQVKGMRAATIDQMVSRCIPENAYPEQWDVATLKQEVERVFGIALPVDDWAKEEGIADEEIRHRITDATDRQMAEKAANFGPAMMRMAEKQILLQVVDQQWKEHLLHLEYLRQGIHLRGYGQRDPLNEYKREAFEMFDGMLGEVRETTTRILSRVQIRVESPDASDEVEEMTPPAPDFSRLTTSAATSENAEEPAEAGDTAVLPRPMPRRSQSVDRNDPSTWGKVARNAPCPCGSGKKFKHCHGRS